MLLKLNNIGPHRGLSLDFTSEHSLIFAGNSKGKSFIARSLNAVNNYQNQSMMTKLVSIDADSAYIHIDNSIININKNGYVKMINEPDYPIFVFNEDYITDNLKVTGFQPNGNIEGIILGKANIDIQSDRYKLLGMKTAGVELKEKITAAIEKSKKELKRYDISNAMNDYKAINFENIEMMSKSELKYSNYQNAVEEYLSLKDFSNINVNIPVLSFDISFDADNIKSMLETSYTASSFTDDFKTILIRQEDFIRKGLALSNGTTCPFCGQAYSDTAIELIDKYNQYLKDSETMIKSQLKGFYDILSLIYDKVCDICNKKYPEISNQAALVSSSLAKSKRITLHKLPDTSELLNCINNIKSMIESKIKAIDRIDYDLDNDFSAFESHIHEFKKTIEQINLQIGTINANANSMAKEKLRLKKEICKALQMDLSIKLKDDFSELQNLRIKYKTFLSEVQKRESEAKISKKALVADTFSVLIERFWKGKYSFDKDTFSITFKDIRLYKSAEDILSDGEKTIIALLFSISNIHSAVNNINDYGKMLIVFDDPSSNLDAENTAKIAEIISDIGNIINVGQDIRTITLTHDELFKNELINRQSVNVLEI